MKPRQVFDALKFFQDHRIDFRTAGNSHCSPGWIQIHCPFCPGEKSYHLGVNVNTGSWNCWRCGRRKLGDVLKAILGSSPALLSQVRAKYGGSPKNALQTVVAPRKEGSVKWPPGIVETPPKKAIDYLGGRGFDAGALATTWGLRFTGPTGGYKFRVIAPIYHDGRMVSFQGRDYTGKAELRYKACRKEDETRDHKECLYGSWLVTGSRGVVVEGIADAWRLGPGAVATFGISYTTAQMRRLAFYKEVVLVFDSDPQAIRQAETLGFCLKNLNPAIVVRIVEIEGGDPGELSQWDADKLMFDLIGRGIDVK